jgi:SAM-dependent methyltransferase
MHQTASDNCSRFFNTYGKKFPEEENVHVVEIGSQNVNGSLRSIFPSTWKYTGLDFAEGNGVDIILEKEYTFPLDNESADMVITSSCFEHSEMFWLSFLEGIRILKPNGLFYINAPSGGHYHGYPGDSWRFFPDAGRSLSKWANHNGYKTTLLESYITDGPSNEWNDFVCIILKDVKHANLYTDRIIHEYTGTYSARSYPDNIEGSLR